MEIKVSADDVKVISIIKGIQDSIDNGDELKLDAYINDMACNVREELKDCKKQAIVCLIIRFLNKIALELSGIDLSTYLVFNHDFVECSNELEYEKYVLRELRKYLKNCNRNKKYDNLILAFAILLDVVKLRGDSCEKVRTSIRVWANNIKGINYIPVANGVNRDCIKNSIDVGIKELKRTR